MSRQGDAKGQSDQDTDKKATVLHSADEEEGPKLGDQMEDDYDASRIQYGADGAVTVDEAISQHIPMNDMLDREDILNSESKHVDVLTTGTVRLVAEWSVDDVQAWMCQESRKAIFEPYLALFRTQKVKGSTLLELTDNDLMNIGIGVLGDRKDIMRQVDSLKVNTNNKDISPSSGGTGNTEFGQSIFPFPLLPTDKEYRFQNRDEIIKRMARAFLMMMTRTNDSDASQTRSMIFTTAQMWGSGKSWLGNHFLRQLRKRVGLCHTLKRDFGHDAEGVYYIDKLLSCKYVLIDLRRYLSKPEEDLEDWLKRALVKALLRFPTGDFPEGKSKDGVIKKWSTAKVASCDIGTIVAEFMDLFGVSFFIHFDELDHLLENIVPLVPATSLAAVNRFYAFWKLVAPILFAPSFLYCSGRSSILYALGRHMYRKQGVVSPYCSSECLLLDTLKQDHITVLVKEYANRDKYELGSSSAERVAELIFNMTKGIPRLVVFVLDFMVYRYKDSSIDLADMGKAEFWNDYRAFCKLDKDGKKEISPITALDPSLHAIYLELVRIGSLRIPINLNKVVRPQAWGLPSSEIKVPMLELVQLFNLYIEEVPVPAPVALPAFKGHKMGYTDIDDVETEEMDLGDEMEHDDFVSESEDEDEEYKPYSDSDSDSGSDFDFADDLVPEKPRDRADRFIYKNPERYGATNTLAHNKRRLPDNDDNDDGYDDDGYDDDNDEDEDYHSQNNNENKNKSKSTSTDSNSNSNSNSNSSTVTSTNTSVSLVNEWFIVFPPVVLDEIAASVQDPRLPFWSAVCKSFWLEPGLEGGALMETIGRNSIILRLGEKLSFEDGNTFAKLMPFYEDSLFANTPPILADPPVRHFVTFTVSKTNSIETMSHEEQDTFKKKVEQYLASTSYNAPNHIQVSLHDWEWIRHFIVPNVIYQPASFLSASADLFYFASSMASTWFQWKGGKQKITPRLVIKEAKKVLFALSSGHPVTFVVVGLNVDQRILTHSEAIKLDNNYAVRFNAGAKLSYIQRRRQDTGKVQHRKVRFMVPNKMDIIVLTSDGVDFFLTKQNADMLRSGKPSIYNYVQKLLKPKVDV